MNTPDGTPLARRVLIAHPSAALYGSDRVMLESVSAMTERGWEVVVTLPTTGPLADEIERRGASVALCPSPVLRKAALRPLGLVRLLGFALRCVRPGMALLREHRPDVVYVSTITVPLWLLLARMRRTPVLGHVHEAESTAPALIRKALAAPLLLANRVVTNSEFSTQVVSGALGMIKQKTTVVYNAVPGPDRPLPPRPTLDGPLRILYVGRLSLRKGVHVLIASLAELVRAGADARLDVVGAVVPGDEWVLKQFEAETAEAGITDRVHFHGFQVDVWSHFSTCDIAVVPSTADESFGNTSIEAILALRPVVVSATAGLLEAVAGMAAARIVEPGDPLQLAAAITDIAENWSDVRDQVIVDARHANEQHSVERYRRTIAELISAALEHGLIEPNEERDALPSTRATAWRRGQ